MNTKSGQWTDERTEITIGVLLQTGVLLAACVVILGAAVYLSHFGSSIASYHDFLGEPNDLRGVSGIIRDALAWHGRGIIQFGLLILIATPVARVAFAAVAFAMEHDSMYVIVSLIVLGVLLFSLIGGHF